LKKKSKAEKKSNKKKKLCPYCFLNFFFQFVLKKKKTLPFEFFFSVWFNAFF